ncbi:hypothetical protein, partial [Escherichia coli]|uniref:hypothetical protein n=1 Tax=Escherichia coli TaxID=562 RepID=UPI0028DF9DDF
LTNPTAYDDRFQTANAALDHWAAVAPARSWLAERAGQGWRRVGFGEAHGMAAALAGGLRTKKSEAHTLITLVDARTTEQLYVAEGVS